MTQQAGFLPHRNDIDGLRAIAVLGVVIFHAGLGLPGGFTGVDVFFVISGYLITSLIAEDLRAGTFSLRAFYERRMRRILPAFFAVMAATAVAAWVLLMPPELMLFGRSLALAVLSISNFGFWLESGYFDVAAHFKPLMHTWSLGVEEQFYVIFPVLLLGFSRFARRSMGLAISIACLMSLLVSVWWAAAAPQAAFYLLPSRFWELAVGALLALYPAIGLRKPWQALAAVVVGLGLIATGYLSISAASGFPGFSALLPVGGAALIIAAGRTENVASRLLGAWPLSFIGLISYSLYLVHWPVIVFMQYRSGHVLTPAEALLVIAASIGVSALLWRYVEQPFRQRRVLASLRSMLPVAGVTSAALIAFGVVLVAGAGWPQRLPDDVRAILAAKQDAMPYASCIREAKSGFGAAETLQLGDLCNLNTAASGKPRFIVWGDSHAAALAPAIAKAAGLAGQGGTLAAHGGCPPLLAYDVPNPSTARRASCRAFNQAVLDLVAREKVPMVFLVGRWPREILGVENGQEGIFYDPSQPVRTVDRSRDVADALDATLAQISAAGAMPVLVMDVPEPGYDVPVAMARARLYGRTLSVDPPRNKVDERQKMERRLLVTAAARHGALLIDPTTAFCDETDCDAERDGTPLYVDADHLTRSAAEDLSPLFATAFRRLEMRKPHLAEAATPHGQDYW